MGRLISADVCIRFLHVRYSCDKKKKKVKVKHNLYIACYKTVG